jgi:hypothetical protein
MSKTFQLEATGEPLRYIILYVWELALAKDLPLPYYIEATDANHELFWSGAVAKNLPSVCRERHGSSSSALLPLTIRLEADDQRVLTVVLNEELAKPTISV